MSKITRRHVITAISQSVLGLLSSVATKAASGAVTEAMTGVDSNATTKPHSIIWIWPDGGAPQTDMFDAKPRSDKSVRGILRTIDVPDMTGPVTAPMVVTDCFPRLAAVLRHCAVLRARSSSFSFHLEAMASVLGRTMTGHHLLTGHAAATGDTPFVYGEAPGVISGFDYRRGAFSVPRSTEVVWDKTTRSYRVPDIPVATTRDLDRRDLLQALPTTLTGPTLDKHDRATQSAYRLMVTGLNTTIDQTLINRYGGQNETAMGILTMRELCRQGFSGALLFRDGDWDTHYRSQQYVRERGPQLDRAVSELILDIHRGQLGNTLLVYCGEFGRTPLLNVAGGRDHFKWHTAFLCGSQIRCGQLYGETNSIGEGISGQVTDGTFIEIVREATALTPDRRLRQQLPPVFKTIR